MVSKLIGKQKMAGAKIFDNDFGEKAFLGEDMDKDKDAIKDAKKQLKRQPTSAMDDLLLEYDKTFESGGDNTQSNLKMCKKNEVGLKLYVLSM
jgi:hypothetical protein